jgi:hypothetical protein
MKSRTKPVLRALPAVEVQISLPVQGVLRDVRHALLGLCIDAGQKVPLLNFEWVRLGLGRPQESLQVGSPQARGQGRAQRGEANP